MPLDTWQALLTKLAQTPLENFDNADLHQLYQTYLLLDSASEACECGPVKAVETQWIRPALQSSCTVGQDDRQHIS